MSARRINVALSDRRGDDWSAKASDQPLEAVNPVAEAMARAAQPSFRYRACVLEPPSVARCLSSSGGSSRRTVHKQGRPVVHRCRANSCSVHSTGGELGPSRCQRLHPRLWSERNPSLLGVDREPGRADSHPDARWTAVADRRTPDVAVREAVVNAFMHRDYRTPEVIQLEHTASRLRITSPEVSCQA